MISVEPSAEFIQIPPVLHAVQEPQFCKAGRKENDTNGAKLESGTGDLEGKRQEVGGIQITFETFDSSQLN